MPSGQQKTGNSYTETVKYPRGHARERSASQLVGVILPQEAMNGKKERDIMRQTDHKSSVMPAAYIRIGQMFTHNAAAGLCI